MYHLWPLILLLILLFAVGLVIFLKSIKKTAPKQQVKPVNTVPQFVPNILDKAGIKRKYLEVIDKLYTGVESKQINTKDAFQELSAIIRDFIKEVSGVDVTKCTLSEIKKRNIPKIANIISEYYEPEFAFETDDDSLKAIKKAKKVIEQWN